MDYSADQRVVMTLDAGGTNFVFSAMQGGREIVSPVHQTACVNSQSRCLAQIAAGFRDLRTIRRVSLAICPTSLLSVEVWR